MNFGHLGVTIVVRGATEEEGAWSSRDGACKQRIISEVPTLCQIWMVLRWFVPVMRKVAGRTFEGPLDLATSGSGCNRYCHTYLTVEDHFKSRKMK